MFVKYVANILAGHGQSGSKRIAKFDLHEEIEDGVAYKDAHEVST